MDINKILGEMTLEEKAGMCSGRDFWHTKAVERLGVPSVMMCDGPHGLRKQEGEDDHLGINESIKAVSFPTAPALASSFDRALVHSVGETIGNECQAENVALLLGPGLNIKRSPLCGRNFEYFSEDPYLSAEITTEFVKGLQSKKVGACLKHYVANEQETLRMTSDSVVDERTLREIYLAAFEKPVRESKPYSVMCSYNMVNGEFLAENRYLLTDVLRDEWGFEGFVVTDWGAVQDRVKGLLAGLDLEMPGINDGNQKKIIAAVQDGTLPEAKLDEAVGNILSFVKRYSENRDENAVFDREKDHTKAADVATECAVLLKNEKNLLPLSKSAKVAFIGEFAENPRYQGSGSSHINPAFISNAAEAAKKMENVTYSKGYIAKSEEIDEGLEKEALEAAKNADVVVIFAGLPNSYETEGVDRKHLDMPQNQNHLIEAVSKVSQNVVVVLHNGAPVAMPWINSVSSVLEMYLAGDNVGNATVSLLFGDANPSGKLAETFPLRLTDTPSYMFYPGERGIAEYREGIYIGYRYYDKREVDVLFPFGHGLCYTKFEYSELKLSKTKIMDTEKIAVSVKVKNIGQAEGKEVVQVYVQDVMSSVGRPVRELKQFEKVNLKPGEEKVVTLELDKQSFAYYEPRLPGWHVESGEFSIEVGSSSRDIRLSAKVEVESTQEIPILFTRHSTMGEIMSTQKGRAVMESMNSRRAESSFSAEQLGEGAQEMVKAMMMEMPLKNSVSFGAMNEEQLEGLLQALNS